VTVTSDVDVTNHEPHRKVYVDQDGKETKDMERAVSAYNAHYRETVTTYEITNRSGACCRPLAQRCPPSTKQLWHTPLLRSCCCCPSRRADRPVAQLLLDHRHLGKSAELLTHTGLLDKRFKSSIMHRFKLTLAAGAKLSFVVKERREERTYIPLPRPSCLARVFCCKRRGKY